MMRPGNRCLRGGRRVLLLTCRSVAPPLHFTASTSHPDAPDERVDSHLPDAGVGVTGTITARTRRGIESTMPTYDYECPKCGHEFETYQPITDDPLTKCPQKGCRGKIQRLIGGGGGLLFKGSGFYITDYRSDNYKKAAKADSSSPSSVGGESKSSGDTSSSSDSKSSTASSKSD